MPDIIHVLLFLFLIVMGFSQNKSWLYAVAGIGVIAIALPMIPDNQAYGFPYLAIGFGMFILGIFGKGANGEIS